jgi:hypothetical protein
VNQSAVINLRLAANGFVIHYSEIVKGMEVEAEFVALDLEEALSIIHDCYTPQEHGHDMSNILDETIDKA